MLSLIEVSRSFDDVPAVRSFSLTVEEGRTTVLIGPSGCGKSTVLRLIIGLLEPHSGVVEFDGERVAPETALLMRRKMGYVIQEGGLFPHLTTYDNITLMASHLGWDPSRIGERVGELSALTRFPSDGLRRYPAQLSGGQRQRVSLMRALMLDPELLLMDEPLGALDPLIRVDLQQELRSIFRELAKTVIMVTHDLGEAAYLADTMVLMREGAIVQQGTLEEMTEAPSDPFVTRFVKAQRGPQDGTPGNGAP
jgi:osmoprotectant transport system ATP-binding protein